MYRIINALAFIVSLAWLYTYPSFEPLLALLITVAGFFRDDIHGVIGRNVFSLTPRGKLIRDLDTAKFSFVSSDYINPRILDDLIGCISDTGEQVVSVNLQSANESNRYFAEINVVESGAGYPLVKASFDGGWVAYKYIGLSITGMHVVQVWSNYGGSGVFCNIVLVTLGLDSRLDLSSGSSKKVVNYLLKLVGVIPLGEHYDGNISYNYGLLKIPPCKGRSSLRAKFDWLLIV